MKLLYPTGKSEKTQKTLHPYLPLHMGNRHKCLDIEKVEVLADQSERP